MNNDCPVCGSSDSVSIDHRPSVPVFLNRLGSTAEDARAIPRGILDIAGCRDCGFVWNRAFEAWKVDYDSTYENDQTHSRVFRAHLLEMADRILGSLGPGEPLDVLEIGCGQGVFLRVLAERAGSRFRRGAGFDPAFRTESCLDDARIRVFNRYFDAASLDEIGFEPNVIVSRHTIEHVPEPRPFLATMREAARRQGIRLFLETPDVRWILDRAEVQDLFYEHCSLFSVDSLTFALQRASFATDAVETVFGGQYLWAQASASDHVDPPPRGSFSFPQLSQARRLFSERWQDRIDTAGGRAIVWGAGAKGVTFCQLVDADARHIQCVVDVNPQKQGRYIPGTGHAIRSPDALVDFSGLVIVMNPNYTDEIREWLTTNRIRADLDTL